MKNKQLSIAYLKNLFPILFLYVSISLFDWICSFFMDGSQNFIEAIFGLFDYSTDRYSWYVEMYIGLYLVIPLLNLIWQSNKNRFFHFYVVGVSLLLFFIPSLLNSFGKVIPDFWLQLIPSVTILLVRIWQNTRRFKKDEKNRNVTFSYD